MSWTKSFSNNAVKLAIYYAVARRLKVDAGDDLDGADELREILGGLGVSEAPRVAREISAAANVARKMAEAGRGGELSAAGYDKIRASVLAELGLKSERGVMLWPPTHQTIMSRLGGSWAGAMAECGLAASSDGQVGKRNTRFSHADRMKALRAYLNMCEAEGAAPSYVGYTRWAKERQVPSGSSIRQTYGTWLAALEALEEYEA